MEKFTIKDFNKRFPTNDACLEEIKRLRFSGWVCPKCQRQDMLTKVSGRQTYACPCGHQVYPLSGTIFHKSSTELRTWFYAIYLMAQTRAGISAKQLERMTGVTYKTAWRMFKQIRQLMADGGGVLSGTVEIDETYIGGKEKGINGKALPAMSKQSKKTPVMGLVERGGKIKGHVVQGEAGKDLLPHVISDVAKDAQVMTDQLTAYQALRAMGYSHSSVNHTKEYVRGIVHTNTIEGFWSQLKGGIRTVYKHVDNRYLQHYVDEYAFRYSHRHLPKGLMFDAILSRVIG